MTQSAFVSGAQDHAGAPGPPRVLLANAEHRGTSGRRVFRPRKPNSGIGVERSLPRDLENSRKRGGHDGRRTVWLPMSSRPVSQQPSRKNPVIGLIEQTSSRSPSTLQGVPGRTASITVIVPSALPSSACGVVDRLPIFGESHLRLPTRAAISGSRTLSLSPRCGHLGCDGHFGQPGFPQTLPYTARGLRHADKGPGKIVQSFPPV